ncbi:helix-turn-helix domain-containing protein [Sediminispirochaeta smaragdinae]|uniref:Helix-turn-helix domain-containing protein n=1 Tax=Sediminispirochaeta smaragdinae (strain DSM 11293 / JCM 15392 / SEBR 4228) TaxID=573413 RepID=E1R6W1_SEDSS|nr:helix-turn-helix domain-containing protein [Sediminispirochaeta smaragdinae]ADK81288.1 hypothetical protein Spirs_2168 [Sediminispirochaeta smaragdinae DSM 11293]
MTYMNQTEAAKYLHVSPSYVSNLTRQKMIPHKRIGGKVIYTKELLDRWILEDSLRSVGIDPKKSRLSDTVLGEEPSTTGDE